MDIHGTQKMIAEEHYSYNQYKFSQNYDVFEVFKKCRNLVNRKQLDAPHKYFVDFIMHCEASQQKRNLINKR